MHTNTQAGRRGRITLVAVLATVIGLVASMMFAATASAAGAGSSEEGTGSIGRIGANGGWNGTYMTPVEGGEEEGWCIDPGLPEPMAGGNLEPYGEPVVWEAPNDQQKTQLLAALTIGETAMQAKQNGVTTIDIPNIDQLLGSNDVDAIGAAVSGVIHKIGFDADPRPGASWDANRMDSESRAVYENMLNYAEFIPGVNLETPLLIREPAGDQADYQRMILMGDVQLPEIEVPEIEIAIEEAPVEEKVAVPGKIHVNKFDENEEFLPGATFELRELDEEEAAAAEAGEDINASEAGEVIYTWETEDDTLTFLVDAGTFVINEVEAPEGYTGEFSEIVTVGEDEEVTVEATNTPIVEEEPAKAPIEHDKAPVQEQERATIVSVPSGPVGSLN